MNTKAKIALIVKILLVLMLVPVGIVSFGAQKTSTLTNQEYRPNNTWFAYIYGQDIGFSYRSYFNQQSDWKVSDVHDSYDNARNNLISTTDFRDPVNKFGRIFSLKQGPYHWNWTDPNYPSDKNDAISKADPEGTAADNSTWSWVKNELPNNRNNAFDSEKSLSDPYAISFFNIIYHDGQNLNYRDYQISVSTENPSGGCYLLTNDNEEAQQVLWNYWFTAKAARDKDGNAADAWWHSYETRLYDANQAYNDSVAVKNNDNTGSITDISVSTDEDVVGTYKKVEGNKDYIIVGPFNISNHPYAEDKNGKVSEYSGKKEVLCKNTLVGLIDCEITIKDENNANRTYKSSESSFSICYSQNGNTQSNINTGYCSSYSNIKAPEQYEKNRVPYPGQDFYIKIASSMVKDGDYMTNLKLIARDTVALGTGVKFNQYQVKTTATLTKKETEYKCNTCGYTTTDTTKLSYNSSSKVYEHDCKNFGASGEERHHHTNSCFTWKHGYNKTSDGWKRNGVWYKCLTSDCDELYPLMRKHIIYYYNKYPIDNKKFETLGEIIKMKGRSL